MNTSDKTREVEMIQRYFSEIACDLEGTLLDTCHRLDGLAAHDTLNELLRIEKIKHAANRIAEQPTLTTNMPTYMMSSIFVRDAFEALAQAPEEDMRFATGVCVSPRTYAITRLLKFELSVRTAVEAAGDQESVNRVLIYLHNTGHKLLMTWHIHPGSGVHATSPSGIDMDFHRRLELGNYPAIGAIFSRDGYVRFFSYERSFKVSIHGEGVEVIDEDNATYKLTAFDTIQE